MAPITDQKTAAANKRVIAKAGVEALIMACGQTCDYCPIVMICEKCFKEEPRKWRKYANWHTE